MKASLSVVRALALTLPLIAAAGMARSSAAGPDAGTLESAPPKPATADGGAPRVVIPPLVAEETLPAFDAEPFPEDKSKAPKPAEWKEAPRVRLSRVAERASDCRAYRVREWMKIHCDRLVAGLRLLAGSTEGIALWIWERPPGASDTQFFSSGHGADVIFPARRGDRRIFQAIDIDFGEYEGWGTAPGVLIEERWPERAKSPEIALLTP